MTEFDDGLEGILGSETPEGEGAAAVAGADAVALALALQKAGNDPALSRAASAYLAEQRHLVQIQIKHFDEERRLGIAAAKRRRYADHMRNGLYTFIALIALGVLLAATRMTLEAMSDQSLVVEDFTVPSDLAARGITSQALAEDLASRVAAIRATANRVSVSSSSEVRANQTGVLKVQIPETGISVDELERFLHRWLGHQTAVSGELREEASGAISLVLHIAGADPIVVNGSSADLDRLMQAAAERAFAIFDPTNNVIYLGATSRIPEAYAAAQRYVHSASLAAQPNRDQARAYALLSDTDPDPRRALASASIATHIDPRVMVGWMEASAHSQILGHSEAAVDFTRKLLGTRRQDQAPSERARYPMLIAAAHVTMDRSTGDFSALQRDFEILDRSAHIPFTRRYAERAQALALLHDEATARQNLALAVAAGAPDRTVLAARWDVSTAAGDWAGAVDAAKALIEEEQQSEASSPDFAFSDFAFWQIPAASAELALATQYRPLLAYAEAMTGDPASATALIAQTPTDCYLCVRTRAKIAAVASDAVTADHWFAEAVRQAPDLPTAYYEWGEALLARGDLVGAVREFSRAHDKGPHFADPLKAWGDVLVREGHPEQALTEYDEALKYAPNWAALKQARDAAASRRG